MKKPAFGFSVGIILAAACQVVGAEPPALHRQLKDIDLGDRWVYNDVRQGMQEAKDSGKPMLVVFR